MSAGFENKNGKATVIINDDEVSKLLKKYKKIKKYMKSPLYTVKTIDGTEEIVSSLLKESKENPID
jgi:hypothetical protein